MARYYASGSDDFRAFVNYEYVAGSPLTFFVPTIIGAVTGVIGGLGAMAARHRPPSEIRQR